MTFENNGKYGLKVYGIDDVVVIARKYAIPFVGCFIWYTSTSSKQKLFKLLPKKNLIHKKTQFFNQVHASTKLF